MLTVFIQPLFLLFTAVLCTLNFTPCFSLDDNEISKRVYAHLLLKDAVTAEKEVLQGLAQYPQSQQLRGALIKVRAAQDDEVRMLNAWQQYIAMFPDDKDNHDLLESMSWAIIEKGSRSSSLPMRLISMLGGFFANDIRGVMILESNMRDSNSMLRGAAVQLSSHMRDTLLKEKVLDLFYNETTWDVYIETINAVGSMHIIEAREDLVSLLSDDASTAEEKSSAIQSLVNIMDTAERGDVARLATSNRAGLRLLACEVVAHFDLVSELDYIFPLLRDSRPEVRAAAVQVIGILRINDFQGYSVDKWIKPLTNDPDPTVSITAAWALTLSSPAEGQQAFSRWLNHPNLDIRRQASGALVATGKYGLPLVRESFYTNSDSYVKLNLALGLLSQRIEVDQACKALYEGLSTLKENWMFIESGINKALVPSTIKHQLGVPQHPRIEDQMVRLEILNSLAMLKYPKAMDAVKQFLLERSWGITGIAVALLLTEGDEDAMKLVRTLLDEENPKIKLQAALVLSLWGRDESAIAVLENAYLQADREMKERILEALGRIGAESSIPFLVKAMGEPYQSLRIIAACALIQSLNH